MLRHNLLLPVSTGDLLIDALPPITEREILLSLVIPTYQERHNIAEIVRLLTIELDRSIPNAYELIVVDDNSPDLTWEVARDLYPQYPHLRVLRRVQKSEDSPPQSCGAGSLPKGKSWV